MRALAAAVAALAVVSAPAAQAAAHPNLSGYWELKRKLPPADPALKAKVAPNTVEVPDAGAAELGAGDFGGLKLTPEALARAKAWKPQDDMTIAKACQPPTIIYALQGPFPIQIEQGTELIVMHLEYYDMVRVIHMDRRTHLPADAPDSKVGDSIGHWEGDTLVVDTTHLEPATITNNGLFHSNKAHVIERFKLSPDGKTLLASQEFEDPEALLNRGVRYLAWDKREGQYIYPYDCDPTFVLNYGARAK